MCDLSDGGSMRRRGYWGLEENRQSRGSNLRAMYLQGLFHSSAAQTGEKNRYPIILHNKYVFISKPVE